MQNYSNFQKFLHDFILNKKFINKSLFEIEKMIFLKNNNVDKKTHVFITSLPRSGTTSLLNFLYSSNSFASLTYKNMPFILSPHFSNFFNKRNTLKKERMHKDGIIYDINSPEAFDEIFFDNNEDFIKNELLNYVKLILISKKKERYLSKNNLNYKRIDLIKSIIPNSKFLIPIREPLHHAYSLLQQHLHFSKLQKEDDFIKRYMNYLGHNEFGIDHKSWKNPINFDNFNDINYWLEQWYLFYQDIIKKYQSYENCFFIFYEDLTNLDYLNSLLRILDLNKNEKIKLNFFKNSNKNRMENKYSYNLYKKTVEIYSNFKNQIKK